MHIYYINKNEVNAMIVYIGSSTFAFIRIFDKHMYVPVIF